jgi:NAD(P)-dependent dehydrogenase (short-subunit alcohol dehydrogenase family)
MASPRLPNVFLTGAGSGIGRATADLLVRHGYAVWGTSRDGGKLEERPGFHAVEMRLEDGGSIRAAWTRAEREAGSIDIVIQNAGAGIFGAIEEVTAEDARAQWQVLVEGPLQLLQLAAAHLRPRRRGLIIGVSSLAAELPMPFSAHYSAGKSAFSALLAGLAMELQPFGVRVVDLRPGDIKTAFNDALPKTMPAGSPYFPWAQRAWQECARLMNEAPPPDLVARAILKIMRQSHPPAVTRVGAFFQAALGPLGVRLLPQGRLRDSIRAYYGLKKIDEQQRPRT